MKTRKLRLLSALLALAMLLALLPTAAFAEDTVYGTISGAPGGNCGAEGDGSDVKWSFDTTTGTLIISGTGAMKDYTNNLSTRRSTAPWAEEQVAQVVINEGVTRIGNSVFGYCNNLKNIEIPETVTKIGGSAFQGAGLTSIKIPASVTDIGNFAFEQTKLTSIKIPASVTNIGILAFNECENLQTVTFADDSQLKNIGTKAFAGTPITSIEIPASVTNIGRTAFNQCRKLESVTFAPGSKLETIGENAFSGCDNLQTVYYDGNNDGLKQSLQSQLGEKFKNGWTVKFETEGGSEVAQQNVKNGQTATKPTDPAKDGYIFAGWYTKDAVGNWAAEPFDFNTAIMDNMTLYAKWTPGGTCGVGGNDLTWTLDDSGTLTISGTGAMYDYDTGNNDLPPWYSRRDQIQEVVIGNGVTSIGNDAFYGCTKLETVDLSNATSLEKIGQYAFALCKSLSEITIPAKVERIGEYAFYDCYDYNNHSGGLKTVTFAENSRLTTIEEHAFYKCRYLEKIEIPASVTSIGGYAFNSCANLKELAFAPNSQLKSIGEYAFGAVSTDTVSPAYTSVQIPASVSEIGKGAFYHCLELKTVVFEEGSQLKALGDGVFVDCGSLKEFTIPANVETIGEAAFAFCVKLEKITIPKSVKKIGQAAFALCPLKTVYYDGTAEEWANIEIDETKIEIDDIDFSNGILKTTTVITSKEDEPAKPTQYPITIDNGTAYIDGEPVTEAKENDVVTIVADETAFDGMAFERWEVRKGEVKLENDHAAETTFTMPEGEVQLEAMYQAADANDSGWDAATVVTGAVIGTGTAILAYHIGMEVYAEQVLGKDVAVPRTRSEVALLAWQLAGSPAVHVEGEPLSEAAQAERWAVESGLMEPDAEGNFNGTKKMSKWNALRTLDAAKKMG